MGIDLTQLIVLWPINYRQDPRTPNTIPFTVTLRIPDHFSTSINIAEWRILRHLLTSLIQSPDIRRHDLRRQGNECIIFCERFGIRPDPYAA